MFEKKNPALIVSSSWVKYMYIYTTTKATTTKYIQVKGSRDMVICQTNYVHASVKWGYLDEKRNFRGFRLSGGARAIFLHFHWAVDIWESDGTGREKNNNLRAKEMSRGRCLRDVSDPPGHLDDVGGFGKLLPLRTPPTAPTPVSRDDADQPTHINMYVFLIREKKKCSKIFSVCLWWMDGW